MFDEGIPNFYDVRFFANCCLKLIMESTLAKSSQFNSTTIGACEP